MRLGEWKDSLNLIGRYPLVGVGFTGTPEIDIYADVANMYLMMANQIGLTGVMLIFLLRWPAYSFTARAGLAYCSQRRGRNSPPFTWVIHAALITGLVNAVADLYFFRLDFQSSITWFWLIVALCLASSRLARETALTVGLKPPLHSAPEWYSIAGLQLNHSFPLRNANEGGATTRGKEHS